MIRPTITFADGQTRTGELNAHSSFDSAMRYLTLADYAQYEDGNVEGPDGYFWVIDLDEDTLLATFEEQLGGTAEGPLTPAQLYSLVPGTFIVRIDNQGIVWVEAFAGMIHAEAEFRTLQDTFTRWETEVTDDDEQEGE